MHTRHLLAVLSVLAILLSVPTASVAPASRSRADVGRLVDVLQRRYDHTRSISAHFLQRSYASGDPDGIEAGGTVYFKRPHLMRWEYDRPDRQLIVTSGGKVYIYEVEANQVTVLPRDRFLSSEISRAFFLGRGDLRREFVIDRSCRFKGAGQWTLCLRPKREIPQLKALSLTIDPESHLIRQVVVEDRMGGHTVIEFSDIQVDRDIPDALFSFKVPSEAEVFYAQ